MKAELMRITDKNDNFPSFGERASGFVEAYLRAHPGLSQGELAFRLRADKRDLRRLLNDHSIGKPLEERLHGYFGMEFAVAVYGALWGDGPSRREKELERERAEIAARRERLERLRAECRTFRPDPPDLLRVVDGDDGGPNVQRRR